MAAPVRPRSRALLGIVVDAVLLVVAGFCAIAMGLGTPFALLMIGLAALAGFRARRQTWWGLALAASTSFAALGLLTGLGLLLVAKLSAGSFVAVVIARFFVRRY
jgi:hypothetical protein